MYQTYFPTSVFGAVLRERVHRERHPDLAVLARPLDGARLLRAALRRRHPRLHVARRLRLPKHQAPPQAPGMNRSNLGSLGMQGGQFVT